MKQKKINNHPVIGRKEFLVFGSPSIKKEEIEEVIDCLSSGWLGTGPKVQRFEEGFRKYKEAEHAVAVNSCTAALHLSILAAGIGPGDEVITTAMTFCATVNAIIHSGATPVLADCTRDTYCIDPQDIEARITPRTKAIIPVHFAGYSCDMDAIMAVARKHRLKVIEDCAHAIETKYKGRHVGTFGDFGCFSFYVTKNVVTGEGGMVLARKKEDADEVKVLALHGMSQDAWKRFSDDGYKHYQVVRPGFKYNMMDIQAAIGIHQLGRVEANWKLRRSIWMRYQKEFRNIPIQLPPEPAAHIKHGYHLYPILIDEALSGITRDAFLQAINKEKIGVGVHYQSIPTHSYYQNTYGWTPEDYPNSNAIGRQTISLPISPKLTEDDIVDVIAAVKKILKRRKVKIATPISHLFENAGVRKEIVSVSSCLECREESLRDKSARQHVFHSEKNIVQPWSKEDKKLLRDIMLIKKELDLITFHMSVSCSNPVLKDGAYFPGGKDFTRQEMVDNARKNIEWMKRLIGPRKVRIAVENNNYYPTDAYKYITDADFLREVIEKNDIFLLFDLAHARITAHNKKKTYESYIKGLPLGRMIQIHVSREGVNNKGWAFDKHDIPDEVVFDEARRDRKSVV